MAYQTIWHYTDLPLEVVDIIERDLEDKFDEELATSKLYNQAIDKNKRNAKNAWVPTSHWITGFLWHYVMKANRENFLYDLETIDGETLQYTSYTKGEYYGWHTDYSITQAYTPIDKNKKDMILQDHVAKESEMVRKLSFSLQLSDPDDYEGGNFQLIDESGKLYVAPRKRGTIILFDSRTQHRVLKVKKGRRKSIVGWVVGPRWK